MPLPERRSFINMLLGEVSRIALHCRDDRSKDHY
jgi:hypothetical protein